MAGREWRVEAEAAGVRLDKWLAAPERLGSRRQAVHALARGRVYVEDVEQSLEDAAGRVAAGARIRLWLDRPGTAGRRLPSRAGGFDAIFEDETLLVVNKPAGLLTVPLPGRADEPSLSRIITSAWRSRRRAEPFVVHRIDRDTSGLVVFAKDPTSWRALKAQFARREPERVYLAVVDGQPDPPAGTWRDWFRWNPASREQEPSARGAPRALEAVTHYRTVERFGVASWLELRLVSGRRHQIRAQAWRHGHPLAGERVYRDRGSVPLGPAFGRQALHAARLGFDHPRTGRPVVVEAPLPADLRTLLAALRAGSR
jgi:23S rRNA pseudouridine1911/1915/1917 synthase